MREHKKCLFCKEIMYRDELKYNYSNAYWESRKTCSIKCRLEFIKERTKKRMKEENKKLSICRCGCGKKVKNMYYIINGKKFVVKYLAGHNPMTNVTKRKISKVQIGRKLKLESINKRTNTRRINGWFKNRERTLRKMSNTAKGRIFSDVHRMNLSVATRKYMIKNGFNMSVCIGKNEKIILDTLEHELKTKIEREYYVDGFFIDGYSKRLNIAFEVDERHHKYKRMLQRDIERQRYIEKRLHCTFIRIYDY
jgi:hypothetical protein